MLEVWKSGSLVTQPRRRRTMLFGRVDEPIRIVVGNFPSPIFSLDPSYFFLPPLSPPVPFGRPDRSFPPPSSSVDSISILTTVDDSSNGSLYHKMSNIAFGKGSLLFFVSICCSNDDGRSLFCILLLVPPPSLSLGLYLSIPFSNLSSNGSFRLDTLVFCAIHPTCRTLR